MDAPAVADAAAAMVLEKNESQWNDINTHVDKLLDGLDEVATAKTAAATPSLNRPRLGKRKNGGRSSASSGAVAASALSNRTA